MSKRQSPYESLFRKGVAVGHSDIKTDSVNFIFNDKGVCERFTVPTISTVGMATYNGYHYTAKVEKLREWEKANG